MSSTRRNALIVIIIITVLAALTGAGIYFLLRDNQPYKELYENGQILINANGEQIGVFTLDDLLEILNPVEFDGIYKPSGKAAIERAYTGFSLLDIMLFFEITGASRISCRSYDGLMNHYTAAEADTLFIAFKADGEDFIRGIFPSGDSYPDEDGGPFVLIKTPAQFSNDRVRGVVELNFVL